MIEKLGISKAPWRTWSLGMDVYIQDVDGSNIAETMTDNHEDDLLIVAAPDMLEGYINISQIIEGVHVGNLTLKIAINMIDTIVRSKQEKATGKSFNETKELLK